jgi:N-methylhydantoinase B
MIEDPVTFEVIKNLLISSSREMSQTLKRTAFSPNIKERRDCSSAIFDSTGNLVAQSKDIPVHLGAMPLSVQACIEQLGADLAKGTMALHNDPFSGGSHLPDLTLVAPVFHEGERVAFTANRAHHADVGGISPGSMPGMATQIEEEGVLIRPRIVVVENELDRETVADLLSETMTPDERLGDLSAQVAANIIGGRRLDDASKKHGWEKLTDTFGQLRYYSREMMRNALVQFVGQSASHTDTMDSDGAGTWDIPIEMAVSFKDEYVDIDLSGTAAQVRGNINCPIASTLSSIYYVFIALFGRNVPTNEGCWSLLKISVPKGSFLNPKYPAAVSAGNVETSQRIVDVTLGALSKILPDIIPACSQGTMNNLTIGGTDPRFNRPFTFYETIGGGVGAMKGSNGTSGIHSHMTNTLNTPIESLETEYPLRVLRYSLRSGSGGAGMWSGGEGIIREIELLTDQASVSIQSERRSTTPPGAQDGNPGQAGRNSLFFRQRSYQLQSKTTVQAPSGAVIRIETPGGGGWGKVSEDT